MTLNHLKIKIVKRSGILPNRVNSPGSEWGDREPTVCPPRPNTIREGRGKEGKRVSPQTNNLGALNPQESLQIRPRKRLMIGRWELRHRVAIRVPKGLVKK